MENVIGKNVTTLYAADTVQCDVTNTEQTYPPTECLKTPSSSGGLPPAFLELKVDLPFMLLKYKPKS